MPSPASLPSPPFITDPPIPNLRALPALPTSTPNLHLRAHLLHRSADPWSLPAPFIHHLYTHHRIRLIFDLRSSPEISRAGVDLDAKERAAAAEGEDSGGGIRRVWTPVFKEADYSPERVALRYRQYAGVDGASDGFVRAYLDILEKAGPAFGRVFRYLAGVEDYADNNDGVGRAEAEPANASANAGRTPDADAGPRTRIPEPCLIHCSAGKDRTGVLLAILLSLLGIPDALVAAEYALTELALAASGLKAHFIARVAANVAFDGMEEEERRRRAERMVGAREADMRATLVAVRERWGGAEGYVREVCGLGDSEVEGLKRNLLVEGQGDEGDAAVL